MDRRDTLRTLLIGSLAGTSIGSTPGCKPGEKQEVVPTTESPVYGRTEAEKEHDKLIHAETYFNTHELETIAVLCDIILPATQTAGSASDVGVPEFIEFITKDLPSNKIPLRGGLMWLDAESNKRFGKTFSTCDNKQQIAIVDDIAYPDPENKKPALSQGIDFFNTMRNLTLSGYYTTKMGIDELGYSGNQPNIWDGVPEDVLNEHGLAYDPAYIARCVDQSKKETIAEWDEEGNLIT